MWASLSRPDGENYMQETRAQALELTITSVVRQPFAFLANDRLAIALGQVITLLNSRPLLAAGF